MNIEMLKDMVRSAIHTVPFSNDPDGFVERLMVDIKAFAASEVEKATKVPATHSGIVDMVKALFQRCLNDGDLLLDEFAQAVANSVVISVAAKDADISHFQKAYLDSQMRLEESKSANKRLREGIFSMLEILNKNLLANEPWNECVKQMVLDCKALLSDSPTEPDLGDGERKVLKDEIANHLKWRVEYHKRYQNEKAANIRLREGLLHIELNDHVEGFDSGKYAQGLLWHSPADGGGKETEEIPIEKYGVHAAHCCKDHGCKYGYDGCPVVLGKVDAKYPCEYCEDEQPAHKVDEKETMVVVREKLVNFIAKNYRYDTACEIANSMQPREGEGE